MLEGQSHAQNRSQRTGGNNLIVTLVKSDNISSNLNSRAGEGGQHSGLAGLDGCCPAKYWFSRTGGGDISIGPLVHVMENCRCLTPRVVQKSKYVILHQMENHILSLLHCYSILLIYPKCIGLSLQVEPPPGLHPASPIFFRLRVHSDRTIPSPATSFTTGHDSAHEWQNLKKKNQEPNSVYMSWADQKPVKMGPALTSAIEICLWILDFILNVN